MGMHMTQFVSIGKATETELMKVNNALKNSLVQECQEASESQRIQVMTLEIDLIQFVLIMKAVQMKMMKMIYNLENSVIQEVNTPRNQN
jgi:hypothetical protein